MKPFVCLLPIKNPSIKQKSSRAGSAEIEMISRLFFLIWFMTSKKLVARSKKGFQHKNAHHIASIKWMYDWTDLPMIFCRFLSFFVCDTRYRSILATWSRFWFVFRLFEGYWKLDDSDLKQDWCENNLKIKKLNSRRMTTKHRRQTCSRRRFNVFPPTEKFLQIIFDIKLESGTWAHTIDDVWCLKL